MSEAPSLNDRIAARLERLAEMDFAAAEKVHAQLMAAETPEETAALSRSYQRVSRSARQCLMLQMRYERERGAQWAQAKILNRRDEAIREAKVETRTSALQAAVERVAAVAIPNAAEREDRLDHFDMELDEWLDEPDFLTADLDAQVLRACRTMGLPEDLAKAWRRLPAPVYPDADDEPERARADAATSPPLADTG